MTAVLSLAVLLAAYAAFLRGWGRGAGREVRRLRWILRMWLLFGGASLVALAMSGRIDALWLLPTEFSRLASLLHSGAAPHLPSLAATLVVGMAGGMLAGLAIARLRGGRPFRIGRLSSIVPQRRGELAGGAAMAMTAAICEELFFRLALPLAVVSAGGSAIVGFAVATALFGWAHRYQGAAGVIATTVVGAFAVTLYLYSGALWLAMLAHLLIDLNGLVLRPAIDGAWRR